jgi:hypothetical protein
LAVVVVELVVLAGFPDVEVTDFSGDVRQAILGAKGSHDGRDDVGSLERTEGSTIGSEGAGHGASGTAMEKADTVGYRHGLDTVGIMVPNDTTLATKVRNGGGLRSDGTLEISDGYSVTSDGGGEFSDGIVTGYESVTEMVEMDGHRRA